MYSIKQLHFDVKRRANKIDTHQNRNFYVEQIDEYLNEALLTYIKHVSDEVEYNQKRIDDLRQLIVDNFQLLTSSETNNEVIFDLPSDYYRLLRVSGTGYCGKCEDRQMQFYAVQRDDQNEFLSDVDYKPSFEYAETGYKISNQKLIIFTDECIKFKNIKIDYIKKHPRLGNPEQSKLGTYNLPNGTTAVQQDLILDSTEQPIHIADIAVLNMYVDILDPNYQIKLNKILNINKI